jgi:hypothetical protein
MDRETLDTYRDMTGQYNAPGQSRATVEYERRQEFIKNKSDREAIQFLGEEYVR